jgi:hypothetical protein
VSPASVLRAARGAGLMLALSPAGKIAFRGPAHVAELFKPVLLENRAAIVQALAIEAAAPADDARAAVDRLFADMARENERRRDWWKSSPYDRDGNLTIRSILTGETTTIRLRRKQK